MTAQRRNGAGAASHHKRAVALLAEGRLEDAATELKKALLLEQGNGAARRQLRNILVRSGRLQELCPWPGSSGEPRRPRLLAMTIAPNWLAIARLPAALAAAGCDVAALCPEKSFLAATRFVSERYFLETRLTIEHLLSRLVEAVAAWDPDLIIPGDEWCVHILHGFFRRSDRPLPPSLRALIARSCGAPASYGLITDKAETLDVAASLGLRCVPYQVVANAAEVHAFAAQHGYPVVVKASVGASGEQVRICRDGRDVESAVAALSAQDRPAMAPPFRLMAQRYVAGKPLSAAFAALEGRVLDQFVYEPLERSSEAGPSSVIRVVVEPFAARAVEKLVERLGYSGLGGVDFMREAATGLIYPLEVNPRPPITAHLGATFGHDLAAALRGGLVGEMPSAAILRHDTVALFPHEWWRDPASPHLREAHVDVPWDDPELLRLFVTARCRPAGPDRGDRGSDDRDASTERNPARSGRAASP